MAMEIDAMTDGDPPPAGGPWALLYARTDFQEKVEAATKILEAPGNDGRKSVWIFEWLLGKSGWGTKNAALPCVGVEFLCKVLELLPPEYPLGNHIPYLTAQYRMATGEVMERAVQKQKRLERRNLESADQDEEQGNEEAEEAAAVQPLAKEVGVGTKATFGPSHVRLLQVLLSRPLLSFRPLWNHVLPVFRGVVDLYLRQACSDDDGSRPLTDGVVAASQLVLRSLAAHDRRRAFKALLEALPLVAALLGRHKDAQHGEVAAITNAAHAVLRSLFADDHLWGLDTMSKHPGAAKRLGTVKSSEPPMKRAKTESGETADPSTFYQAELFSVMSELLSKPGETSRNCADLVRLLFCNFITSYRQFVECRDIAPLEPGQGQSGGASAGRAEPASENKQTTIPVVSCEFWFFLQMSYSVRSAIQASTAEDGPEEEPLIGSLVDMLGLVRSFGIYRPREDTNLVQARTLDSFCKLMLKRLTASKSSEAASRKEWDGLLEALALDTTPFESRLDEFWAAATDLCPKAVLGNLADADASGASRIASELVKTYARLADLPSCLASLCNTLLSGPPRRARLLGDPYFQKTLQQQAAAISEGAMPQVVQSWEALLSHLPKDVQEGRKVPWAANLLQHLIEGVRPNELAVDRLRQLVFQTFTALGPPPEGDVCHGDGLRLSLCGLSRRLTAWELPPVLGPLRGDARELTRTVGATLTVLARRLLNEETLASGPADLYLRAAVMWFSFTRQEATIDRQQQSELFAKVLEVACSDGDGNAELHNGMHQARSMICAWMPLFVSLTSGLGKDDPCTTSLVSVLVPRELRCWSHLGQHWDGTPLEASKALQEKVWWPAVSLWTRRPEALVEPLQVREPVWKQLADLTNRAVERPGPRQIPGLRGLLGAVQRTSRVSLIGVQEEVVLSMVRALIATVLLACTLCSCSDSHGDPARGEQTLAALHLISLGLGCLNQLLERLLHDSLHHDFGSLADQIVALIAGAKAMAPGEGTVPRLVADVLLGSVSQARQPVLQPRSLVLVKDFTLLLRFLLAQRSQSWDHSSRRAWFAQLVALLARPGLPCSVSGKAKRCEITIPHPMGLVSGASTSTSPADAQQPEKALQLLLAALEAAGTHSSVSSVVMDAVQLHLGDAPSVDGSCVQAQAQERQVRGPACEQEPCCASAGLSLAVLARDLRLRTAKVAKLGSEPELDAAVGEEAESERPACQDDDSGRQGTQGSAMEVLGHNQGHQLEVVVQVVRWALQRLDALASQPGVQQLRRGIHQLIGAWSAVPWPADGNEELWRSTWAPSVIRWVELQAGLDGGVATAEQVRLVMVGDEASSDDIQSMKSLAELVSRSTLERQELVIGLLVQRATDLMSCSAPGCLSRLTGMVGALAVALHSIPKRFFIHNKCSTQVLAMLEAALTWTETSRELSSKAMVACRISLAAVTKFLFRQLVTPLLDPKRLHMTPFKKLSEAESLLLTMAAEQARLALQTCRSAKTDEEAAGPQESSKLLASADELISTMLASVPKDNKRLPFWTNRPHLILDVLRIMLEVVYAAPDGAFAAAAAGDVTRLWEAYATGSTWQIVQSSGRQGLSTYQAKIQRATRGPVIMLLAHALEQQRRWPGVDASVTRSLQHHPPELRREAREREASRWKEVVGILTEGMYQLMESLEGADKLKQGLYTGLKDPLGPMFKELNEKFVARGRFTGEV